MIYSIRFVPEIENDILTAREWYEAKSPGLGEEYLRMFNALLSYLLKRPLSYQKVHGDIRRALFRRFPYSVYYRIEEETVVVYGVFHSARNPEIISDSLNKRE